MNKQDIARIGDSIVEHFISSPPLPEDVSRWSLHVTSGTTESPLVFMGRRERTPEHFVGVERAVVCFGSVSSRVRNALFVDLSKTAPHVLFLDRDDMTPDLARLMAEYKPDHLAGFVSFVLKFGSLLTPEIAAFVHSLDLSGEYITAHLEDALQTTFPNAAIAVRYISTETGPLTKSRCSYQPRNHYHPLQGTVFDIENPDADGVGTILVTRRAVGIEFDRYDIGDIGRLDTTPCTCGEQVTLEIMGRTGRDYLKIAGALLRREEFDRVVRTLPVEDYRVEAGARQVDGAMRGEVRIQFYSSHPGTVAFAQELAEQCAQQVHVTPTHTLAQMVAAGAFAAVKGEWVDAPFPVQTKDTKLVFVELP